MKKSTLFNIGGWLRLIAFHLSLAGFVFASEDKNHPGGNYALWGFISIASGVLLWIIGTEMIERGRP